MYSTLKTDLRKKLIEQRKGLSLPIVKKKSRQITRSLLSLDEIVDVNVVSAYFPINNEVDTKEIIDNLRARAKRIFLPGSLGSGYSFFEFEGWDKLEEGPYGIHQPTDDRKVDADIIEAAIIPGVAFDLSGVRLGYGKGIFDRLLFRSKALKIGLAYEFQIVDKLPKEEHDLVMDIVVTEKKVLR